MKAYTMIKMVVTFIFGILIFSTLTSCVHNKVHSSVEDLEELYTDKNYILHDFSLGHDFTQFNIPFWSNGYPFNCKWGKESISFDEDGMNVSLYEKDGIYYGGEYRTNRKYSYGYFSVMMKAAKCDGVISSFFTYTYNPWDEIDIEFLGNRTDEVQFNYYTKGKGGNEFHYKLGFDASVDFHEYGFYWAPDSITWYVDGKPIYRATKNIPTTEAQIMVNVWNVHPDVKEWAGLFKGENLPVKAEYMWFAYKPHSDFA